MSKKLYESDIEEIAQKYLTGGYSCSKLAKEYGVTRSTIRKRLISKNILIIKSPPACSKRTGGPRKYCLGNEDFFERIDTEEKAYFLGFLYADGCNHGDIGCVEISLQERDKKILNTFSALLGSTRPLQFLNYHEKNPRLQNQLRFNINSIKMSADLCKLGCLPAKSLILKFPTENQVPSYLIRHFIRGYFDGDGSLCAYQNPTTKYWSYGASITSSRVFCERLREVIQENLHINSYVHRGKQHKVETSTLYFSGVPATNKFLTWIYEDSVIFLERKRDSFEKNKDLFLRLKKI